MSEKEILVMTYGTLKRKKYNYTYMEAAGGTFVDEVISAESKYRMVGVGSAFPGIVAGTSQFRGELFSVPIDGIVQVLDYLEGYPVMYDRGFIEVVSETTGKKYKALVYILTQSFINSTEILYETPSLSFVDNVYSWD